MENTKLTLAQARILDAMLSGGCRHTGRGGHPVPAMKALERRGLVRKEREHLWETDWCLTSAGHALALEHHSEYIRQLREGFKS